MQTLAVNFEKLYCRKTRKRERIIYSTPYMNGRATMQSVFKAYAGFFFIRGLPGSSQILCEHRIWLDPDFCSHQNRSKSRHGMHKMGKKLGPNKQWNLPRTGKMVLAKMAKNP